MELREFWQLVLTVWDAADGMPRKKGTAEGAMVRESLEILANQRPDAPLQYDSRPPWETSAPRGFLQDHNVAWFRRDALKNLPLPLANPDQLFDQKNNLYQRTTLHAAHAVEGEPVIIIGGGLTGGGSGRTSLKVLGVTADLSLAALDELGRAIVLLPLITRYGDVPPAPFLVPVASSVVSNSMTPSDIGVRLVQALGADPPTQLDPVVWQVYRCQLAPEGLILWTPSRGTDLLAAITPHTALLSTTKLCLVVTDAPYDEILAPLRALVRQHAGQLRILLVDRDVVPSCSMYWEWVRGAGGYRVRGDLRGILVRSNGWTEQREAVFLLLVFAVFASSLHHLVIQVAEAVATSVWRNYELGSLAFRRALRTLQRNGLLTVHEDRIDIAPLANLGAWVLDWHDLDALTPDAMRDLPVMVDTVEWITQHSTSLSRDEYRDLLLALVLHTAQSLRIKPCVRANQLAEHLVRYEADRVQQLLDHGTSWLVQEFEAGATLIAALWNTRSDLRDDILQRLRAWADPHAAKPPVEQLVAIRWRARGDQQRLDALLDECLGGSWRWFEYPRVGY